jgi:cyclophilin family peptidyl-prolyl cis-trans isomerase
MIPILYTQARTLLLFLGFIVSLLLIYLAESAYAQTDEITSICENDASLRPYLVISTQYGSIEIELYERAAPRAIRRLIGLVRGPIFNPALMENDDKGSSIGYYDGLTFNLTKPHLEIVTSQRDPAGHFEIETEIDADSLGLDRKLIENSGDAMNVMQRELLVAHRKKKKKGGISTQLSLWLKKWKETYNPDFLIGVSRKEINESVGYVYKKGLESKPVTKGSVALRPVTPRIASPRLNIFLQDMPHKTGKWMVIGCVVKGLDLADEISLRPLVTPSHIKPRSYTPLNPVKIDSIKWTCRN